MPITDPVPDDDIRDALITLQHGQPKHGATTAHDPHHHAEEKDKAHRKIHERPVSSENDPNSSNVNGRNEQRIVPADIPLSPFPNIDILLLNESTELAPIQSQGSKSIVDILNTAQLAKQKEHYHLSLLQQKEPDHPKTGELRPPPNKNLTKPHPTERDGSLSILDQAHDYNSLKHFQGLEADTDTLTFAKPNECNKTDEHCKEIKGNAEALDKAFFVQWPPIDQLHHEHHQDVYQRVVQDEGHHGGGEWLGDMHRAGDDNKIRTWKNLIDPRAWINRRLYKVSTPLQENWRAQARFFAKFILIKTIQLLIINLWMLLVALNQEVQNFVVQSHAWMYLSLAIFIVILITVRVIAKTKASWIPLLSVTILIFLTLLIAYPLSAVTFTYKAYCIPMITATLLLTCFTLPFVPFMTQSFVTQPTIIRTGAVLVLVYSVLILVLVAYTKYIAMANFTTLIWVPGLLASEIVLWVALYEFQRILGGFCFNVSERRWVFAALYV